MGFWQNIGKLFTRSKSTNKELQNLVIRNYNGDWRYFVWNYANNIYNIPEVRTAIEKISDVFASMPIYHKRLDKNGQVTYLEDTTSRVLNYCPNPLQNTTQFIKTVVTSLLLYNNAFVEPVFDNTNGKLAQLYPLPFKQPELSIDKTGRVGYVQFLDDGQNKKYNLDSVIYLNRFSSLTGGAKNNIGLYETVLKSLSEQIVNEANPNKPRAILQSNLGGAGNLKDEDKKGTMDSVRANFADNVHGIVYFDKMWQVTPINWTENQVNKDLMQLVINTVYNYFSINDNIINNKASEIEFEMFLTNTIKPLALQFEKEFTNKLFTENEYYYGHRIEFDFYSLSVNTLQAKTQLFSVAIRQGIMNIDECRELIGQPPLENGLGKTYRVTADTIDITVANQYQLGKVNQTETVSTGNTDDINQKKEEEDADKQAE